MSGVADGIDLDLLLAERGRAGAADLDSGGIVDGADVGALPGERGTRSGCATRRPRRVSRGRLAIGGRGMEPDRTSEARRP